MNDFSVVKRDASKERETEVLVCVKEKLIEE